MSAADRAALHAFLEAPQKILLTTHVNPDGDGIGSEVAMAAWLTQRGKTVRILNDSPVPPAFRFLADRHPIEVWDAARAEARFEEADAFVVLDTSNLQRIGRLADTLGRHVVPVAIVDHHVTHRGFGKVNVIEPEASSTGEIVYDLIREAGGTLTREIAEALYIALMTDTGSFKYSNTDSHAHRMAAELLDLGVDPQRLHAHVHSNASVGRIRFFGEALGALEMRSDDRIAVLEAAPEHFQRHGLVGADTEGLVDLPRTITGVEVVVLFSEVEPTKVKVSMRSTGRVSIDRLAASLGGGGHPHAAGAMMRGTRSEIRARVLPELERLVAELDPAAPARVP